MNKFTPIPPFSTRFGGKSRPKKSDDKASKRADTSSSTERPDQTSSESKNNTTSNTTTISEEKRIIIVSDGTGETAAQIIKAAMVQFGREIVYFTRYKNVRNEAQIEAVCEDAASHRALLIYTIVSPALRSFIANKTREKSVPSVDLLGPILLGLAGYFGHQPKAVAGLLHIVDETYFERIAAMEYTIAHDDGRDLTGLDQADLVIIGISRTSKTPLSMYLSHQGWRVANIPMIQGFELPKEIFEMDQRKIVGLTIDPQELLTIRRARLQRLGHRQGGDYANPERVNEEIEFANDSFRRNRRWTIFNVTGKALEETAAEIIKLMASRRLAPRNTLESLTSSDNKIKDTLDSPTK